MLFPPFSSGIWNLSWPVVIWWGGVPSGQKSQAGSPLLFYNDGLCFLDTHTAFPNGPQLGPTRAKLGPIWNAAWAVWFPVWATGRIKYRLKRAGKQPRFYYWEITNELQCVLYIVHGTLVICVWSVYDYWGLWTALKCHLCVSIYFFFINILFTIGQLSIIIGILCCTKSPNFIKHI